MLHTTLHAAGFLLDPEYPVMAQNSNEAMTGFYPLVEQIFTDTQLQVSIASQLSQFRSGHGMFGRKTAKAAASAMPAYHWWKSLRANVPELQQLAGCLSSESDELESVCFHVGRKALQFEDKHDGEASIHSC
jgi:hypothetical protein